MHLHHHDIRALSQIYHKPESEIREYLDMREYAAEYLKARGIEGRWSEVTDTEYAFRAIVNKRKQIAGIGEKRLFEAAAFSLIDDPDGGRLYEFIPDLHKYRDKVREKLLQEFPIEAPSDIVSDPLGAAPEDVTNQRLAETIDDPNNRSKAAEIIKDVIETQESLESDKNSARYVLKQLQKANAAVQSALTGIHRPDAVKNVVAETILSIETGLSDLKGWLNGNG